LPLAAAAGRRDTALELLQQVEALPANPYPPDAVLGYLALQDRQAKDAVAHFEKALESQPDAYLLHYRLAFALRSSGFESASWEERISRAVEHLEAAVRARPTFFEAFEELAEIGRAADLEHTEVWAVRALRLRPSALNVDVTLAELEAVRGTTEEVRRLAERVLSVSPSNGVHQRAE
jgi:tetratricopeptide (TPR) repeat protein